MAMSKKWHSRLLLGLVGGFLAHCLICSCGLSYIVWWAWDQKIFPEGLTGQVSPNRPVEVGSLCLEKEGEVAPARPEHSPGPAYQPGPDSTPPSLSLSWRYPQPVRDYAGQAP